MSSLISLFPTQVFRSQATSENYDLVQKEVKGCLNKILETDNLDDVSWIHEEAGKRRAERNSYFDIHEYLICLLYTSPSPRDRTRSRMPSSA